MAKDRQENEANKAANILLEELEMEKNKEESKRAAAARKREKKKRKKAEKKGGSGSAGGKLGDDDDEEEEGIGGGAGGVERGGAAEEDEEEEEEVVIPIQGEDNNKEKTPEIMEEVRLYFTKKLDKITSSVTLAENVLPVDFRSFSQHLYVSSVFG